jgi:hypothetical protein
MLLVLIIDITCEFDLWYAVWTNSKLLTVTVIHCCLFYSNDGFLCGTCSVREISSFLKLSQQVHIRYTDDLNNIRYIENCNSLFQSCV